jgi:hypothetical protein
LYRWRLRHKTSAWSLGGPAGGRRVAACLGRWRALPQHGPPRRVQQTHIRWIAFLNSEIRSGPKAASYRLSCSRGEGCNTQSRRSKKLRFSSEAISSKSPLYCASFIVNSELHTGARPSVRLCVGLIELLVVLASFTSGDKHFREIVNLYRQPSHQNLGRAGTAGN